MSPQPLVVVSGGFDDIRSRDVRFFQHAATFGPVTALVWTDQLLERQSGRVPRFPLIERLYLLNALRYVAHAIPLDAHDDVDTLPAMEDTRPLLWVDREGGANDERLACCRHRGIEYHVVPAARMEGFPAPPPLPAAAGRKRVVVSGAFDWFHTGHVRFLEEASGYGNLYAVVGHDANVRRLKGREHPLFCQDERRYMVGSVRFVTRALISTGEGWLDADPEIREIRPDVYVVNEDGDQGGKREYCERMGMEYLVLARTPAPGLPRRSSTELRGF
jgi:cytidyltransferase-like protein